MDNKNVKAKRRAYGIVMRGLSGLCAALTAALYRRTVRRRMISIWPLCCGCGIFLR